MKVPRWLTTWLISVVAVLLVAAVIFPIFAQAKLSGGPSCFGTLKHIGTTVGVYASDYNEHFPVADRWNDSLGPYAGYQGMIRDPQNTPKDQCGYAFRHQASGAPVHVLVRPDAFILIFDSTLMERNAHSELWSIPRPGRHSQGMMDNVLFADGHVKVLNVKPDTPTTATTISSLETTLLADDKAGPVVRAAY